MYVTIIGCSGVGYHLAKALLAAGHEVLVVEKSRSRCQLLYDELGSVVLCGDGTDQAGSCNRPGSVVPTSWRR